MLIKCLFCFQNRNDPGVPLDEYDIDAILDDKKAGKKGWKLEVAFVSRSGDYEDYDEWNDAKLIVEDLEEDDEFILEKYIQSNNSIGLAEFVASQRKITYSAFRKQIAKVTKIPLEEVLPPNMEEEEEEEDEDDKEETEKSSLCTDAYHKDINNYKMCEYPQYCEAGEKLHSVECRHPDCKKVMSAVEGPNMYVLSNSTPAYVCEQCDLHNSNCGQAYCSPCYHKILATSSRPSRGGRR